MNLNSNPQSAAGQSDNHQPGARAWIPVLLLLVSVLSGSGCGSIYHRTRAMLPPDPCAQLKLRVEEAQDAEKLTDQAALKLRDNLKRGESADSTATDLDRLEMAAYELGRRATSAQDAAPQCEKRIQFASEIERLQARSRILIERVQESRRGGGALTTREIDALLRPPPRL